MLDSKELLKKSNTIIKPQKKENTEKTNQSTFGKKLEAAIKNKINSEALNPLK